MTHAEAQDLLLDLAYGELAPARAAEIEGHIAGCAECQRDKAALDEARRLAAPLRALEEPRPGFDERIMAAARAQKAPLEVVRAAAPAARRKPRWAIRAALGGSVAAAAALALVVSSSLQSKRDAESAAHLAAGEKPFKMQVATPPAPAVAGVAREAKKEDAAKTQPALAGARDDLALEEKPATHARKLAPTGQLNGVVAGNDLDSAIGRGAAGVARSSGSGGDALGGLAVKDAPQGPGAPEAAAAQPPPPAKAAAAPAVAALEKAPSRNEPAAAAVPMTSQPKQMAPSSESYAQAPAESAAIAPAASVVELEKEAEDAQKKGAWALAATLYRRAADLRGEKSTQGAWDLAHAVECLVMDGRANDARQLRAELYRQHPAERPAQIAAGQALQELDKQGKPLSRPSVKTKAASERDATVPAEF